MAIAFLINCASTKNFMTKEGLYFETNGHAVSKIEVELAAGILATYLSHPKFGYTEKQIKNIYNICNYVVRVESSSISCPLPDRPNRTCQGLHQGKQRLIRYVHHPRLSDTSYVHELLHMILYHTKGSADSSHSNPLMWERACGKIYAKDESKKALCEMNSAEGFVNSMLRGIEDGKKEE